MGWLAGTLPAIAAGAAAPGTAPDSAELRVRESAVAIRESGALTLVDVQVEGRGPFPFVLSLSGGPTILDRRLAEEAGLAPGESITIRNPLAPGEMEARGAKLELAEVGHLMMLGLPVAIADLGPWLDAEGSPRGVLGAGSFAGFAVEIDYPKAQLRIRKGGLPPPDGEGVFDLSWEEGTPVLPLSLPGIEIPAHLDPAYAGALLLPESSARSLPMLSEPARTGSGKDETFSAKLKGAAKIGRVSVQEPEIRWDASVPSARVGKEITKNFVITLDPAGARLRLLDTTAPIFRGPRGVEKYGLLVEDLNAELPVISNVTPASAAHAAQLQHGDVIIAFNGAPAATLDEAARLAALKQSPLTLKIRRGREVFEVTLAFGER